MAHWHLFAFDCFRANKKCLKTFGSAGTPPLWKKLIFEPCFLFGKLPLALHPSEKGAVESETIQLRLKWGGWQSSQSANPVVGLAGSGCRLPFPHLPPVTTSCVISQIRQLSGGLVTHLTQLLRCQLFHQSYVLSLSFLILKIKLLIYQLGILALCLLVKHCQNLK